MYCKHKGMGECSAEINEIYRTCYFNDIKHEILQSYESYCLKMRDFKREILKMKETSKCHSWKVIIM